MLLHIATGGSVNLVWGTLVFVWIFIELVGVTTTGAGVGVTALPFNASVTFNQSLNHNPNVNSKSKVDINDDDDDDTSSSSSLRWFYNNIKRSISSSLSLEQRRNNHDHDSSSGGSGGRGNKYISPYLTRFLEWPNLEDSESSSMYWNRFWYKLGLVKNSREWDWLDEYDEPPKEDMFLLREMEGALYMSSNDLKNSDLFGSGSGNSELD